MFRLVELRINRDRVENEDARSRWRMSTGLLTGRHGFFSCYEAFIHIIDSMFNQHAKWLKICGHIPWRRPISSLNYLLSSHVWRQDQNGFSHQDPGFIDHVVNKKAEVIRVYLPPDANCLLSVTDHCLRSRNYVNVVVAGKQPAPQWLTMDEAIKHCEAGLGMLAPVSQRPDAKILQVLRRQARQDRVVDFIVAECRPVLLEAKPPQPTSDVHGGALVRLPLHDPPGETVCLGTASGIERCRHSIPSRRGMVVTAGNADAGAARSLSRRRSGGVVRV
jgi:D-xylulose 5-phosphate/D-fructose 6-phosphate phosphoketolase/XFP C-terminal domain